MADPMWTLSIILAVVLGGFLLLWGHHRSSGWRGPSKSGARLPKGSFGWPLIGETLAFTQNPATFASSHVKRYGKIFKTSLFGKQIILGLTPEFTKFVTSNNSDVLANGYPATIMQLLGPNSLMFLNGTRHTSMKKLLQKPLLPNALRFKINTLEAIVLENMASWEQRGTVNGRLATEKMTMDTGIWLVLGLRDIGSSPEGKKLLENMLSIDKAMLSIPLNLPGTSVNKGIKAKVALTDYFKYLIEKRKGQENYQGDILGVLLAAQEDPQAREEVKDFDIDMIADNLVLAWIGAYDTSATTLTWILKLLLDNPEVFRQIRDEQQEILKSKDPSAKGPRLSWEDTRKMVYTQKFLQEVHRTISVSYLLLRKVTQDVEYEGHLIPKGWTLGWMQNYIHSDPDVFSEPEKFNPDRFDATPKPYTYLPFAAGAHMCPGIEAAKLISLIFTHHLTTTYIHESAAPYKGMEHTPFLTPKGGYPIHIRQRN